MNRLQFLQKLEEEAALQEKIRTQSLLPEKLKPVTDVIGQHTWKVLLVLSGLMSLFAEWAGL
jgi:hypothetical protein